MSEKTVIEELADKTKEWRESGYRCDFSLIGDILRFQREGESSGGGLRYLRAAQFAALETYWYLRLVCKTPHMMEVYKAAYPDALRFAAALGAELSSRDVMEGGIKTPDDVVALLKNPEWAAKRRLDAAHEAAILGYPGYIFALAMGAGKTVLIGAIIATEFAMAMRYNGGRDGVHFMQNALIFAPGLTIIESLREIADMPMEKILPGKSLRDYQASASIVYPRTKKKKNKDAPPLGIAVEEGGFYNIVVSNTEKIALRAETPRRGNMSRLQFIRKREEAEVVANARLKKITSLPNLGVFSDEAHHTYGNAAGDKIKRVRETVNYLHNNTSLVAAINTTGTPYYKRKMLAEVVFWYGLREGIADNVLKSLDEGVRSYDMRDDDEAGTLREVVRHFFGKYKNVRLPDGAPAKIAFYFKSQDHLDSSRGHIQAAMTELREPLTQILVNTQNSSKDEESRFNRLNNPDSQNRVILLVQKGVEGWNCPSLFACALIKEQTNSVFVLQAATRCLRQTPGNDKTATVYLSRANLKSLDKEMKANFGHDTGAIQGKRPTHSVTLRLREPPPPPLEITRTVRRIQPKPSRNTDIRLQKPAAAKRRQLTVNVGSPDFDSWQILSPSKTEKVDLRRALVDCRIAAARIAANYHLPAMPVLRRLKEFYPDGVVPGEDMPDLLRQVQSQTADYMTIEEKVREVLALIRDVDDQGRPVFARDEKGCRVHRLQFSEDVIKRMSDSQLFAAPKAARLAAYTRWKRLGETAIVAGAAEDSRNLSYHYSPYCFDSAPERDFFTRILTMLNADPDDIRAFVFTGLANARLTDFWFQYRGEDGAYHRYFPDFLLLKNTGEFYVVEVKSADMRGAADVEAKKKAVEELTAMPENRFRYVVIYADDKGMDSSPVEKWIWG